MAGETESIHGFKVHPAASLLPNIGKRDFKDLVQDIKENGLLNPPVVAKDGRLLDGRNRVRAYKEAFGSVKDMPTETFEGDDDDASIARAVYGWNVDRRHLNKKQRISLRIKLLEELGARESEEETAEATGSTKASVQKVKQERKKNPAKHAKALAGDTSGRGRPAGRTYPMRITLSCDGDDKLTPSEAARQLIEKWHNVPRGYLAKLIEQLNSQWTAFQEKAEEAEESEDEGNGADVEG